MTRPAASRFLLVATCAATLAACRPSPPPQFMVSAEPIDIGFGPALMFCVAIDARDPQGVWWWQPGISGCESRSTGPGVFRAAGGRVTVVERRSPIEARFNVPTHSTTRPAIDVVLTLGEDEMLVSATGSRSAVRLRDSLDLPETGPWRRAG